ncbi:MAG TPA: ATP-binding cassette domain-containing protein [Azospirillaceae bacterium]|nr:ATP-binding cassette domain-containing protein [Azospirillaceae bacterium]
MTGTLLEASGLDVTIQSVRALRGFSFTVGTGEMVGLVGRNGAGKTTLMRTIMGHLAPASGTVRFDGRDLRTVPRHGRAALGIGYMPEDRGLVPELTVEENILLPTWVSRTLDGARRLDFVYGVLPELPPMRDRRALQLSGGQQKLVALARALAVGTRFLLLDEPFEGVAPALSHRLSEVIAGMRGGAVSVVISQSDLNHSQSLFNREYMIERGANAGVRESAGVGAPV